MATKQEFGGGGAESEESEEKGKRLVRILKVSVPPPAGTGEKVGGRACRAELAEEQMDGKKGEW